MNTVRLIFPDINGAARGKQVSKEHYDKKQRFAMPCLVLVDDIEGEEAPDATSHWLPEQDKDVLLIPDSDTFMTVPDTDNMQGQVIVDIKDEDGEDIPVAPRSVLKGVLQKYEDAGIEIKIASELEFYITDADGTIPTTAKTQERAYADINALQAHQHLIDEILELTREIGLEPETINKEDCEGQYEITFGPQGPLAMADKVLYFKQLVRDVMRRDGLDATFLAQPFGDLCGSGGHIHISLWQDGKNLFDDTTKHLEQFVAGNILHMRDFSAIYAPNPNSYRRWNLWGRGAKSPSWTNEGRKEAAMRITSHGNYGKHMEFRIAGADSSPHLAYAAILSAGLDGINRKLTDKTNEVAEQFELQLPMSLDDSLKLLNHGAAEKLLGKGFIQLFTAVKLNELKTFNRVVTDWELNTYGKQV